MSDQKIALRLRELLAYHSGASEAALSAESTPQNTEGWDSLANLNLMAAIEEEFGVTFEIEDVMKFRSLREIEAYLEAKAAFDRAG
jgi:acyl carrier protein